MSKNKSWNTIVCSNNSDRMWLAINVELKIHVTIIQAGCEQL